MTGLFLLSGKKEKENGEQGISRRIQDKATSKGILQVIICPFPLPRFRFGRSLRGHGAIFDAISFCAWLPVHNWTGLTLCTTSEVNRKVQKVLVPSLRLDRHGGSRKGHFSALLREEPLAALNCCTVLQGDEASK